QSLDQGGYKSPSGFLPGSPLPDQSSRTGAPRVRLSVSQQGEKGKGQVRERLAKTWEKPHSIEFSGGACHRSSKASRRENLEIEQPVACRDFASFDFHTTLPGMLGPTLVGHRS